MEVEILEGTVVLVPDALSDDDGSAVVSADDRRRDEETYSSALLRTNSENWRLNANVDTSLLHSSMAFWGGEAIDYHLWKAEDHHRCEFEGVRR